MPVLINSSTEQAENLPQDVADSAIKNGTHRIPVVDESGTPGSIPIEDAKEGLPEGYRRPSVQEYLNMLKEAKYGTTEQQVKTGLEGAASAATFGASTAAERALGVKPEDIQGRREVNPNIHAAGQAAGLIGSAVLAPEMGATKLLGQAGEAGAEGLGLGAEAAASRAGSSAIAAGESAGLEGNALYSAAKTARADALAPFSTAEKIGSSTVKMAFENALFAGGDEASKLFSNDPNQSGETALSNIGLAALLGGGFGLAAGSISSALGKASDSITGHLVSAEDKPKLDAGDFRASIENAENLTLEKKAGIIDSLMKERKSAGEVRAAAKEIGAPVLEGMVSDSKLIRQGEDALLNGPPTYSSMRRQALYKEGFDRANSVVESSIDTSSNYSKAELGNVLKDNITKQIDEQAAPIREMYDEIKKYHDAIPLSEKSGPAIARNIAEMKEVKIGNNPLLLGVMEDIQKLKNVDDVKWYKSYLNGQLPAMASSNDKRIVGIISDKLTNLEENSIIRFAENNMKTPEAKAKVLGIIDARASANSQYKDLMGKVGELSDKLGKGKVYGPQDAINFINNLTPESVTTKLFSKNDSEFLNFFSKKFPNEMKLMAEYQRGVIKDAASVGGEFKPMNAIKAINKLEPEIQKHLFTSEQLNKIKAAETYLRSFPEKFNPSGTSHMSAFRAFFEHPIGAAIANIRDYGIERFVGAVGEHPELGTAAKLAHAAVKGERMADKAVKSIFGPTANAMPQFDVSDREMKQLKMSVADFSANPERLMNSGVKNNPIPEYATAFGAASARAVQYLNQAKPNTDKQGVLDSQPVESQPQKSDYERMLGIAQQPLMVLKHIQNGTLTPKDVQTVRAIYPNLYSRLAQKITNQMIDRVSKGESVPYKTRIPLSLFLGQPLDSTMTPSAIMAAQPKAQAPQSPMPQGEKHSTKGLSKLPSMYQTTSQAREQAKRQG